MEKEKKTEKKPYTKPKLTQQGDVHKLTQTNTEDVIDAMLGGLLGTGTTSTTPNAS